MNFDHIIIDASSIINFIRYYHEYFSHYNIQEKKAEFKIAFQDLNEFLISKVKSGEIIIIDKVIDELKSSDLLDFKESIKEFSVNSLVILEDVQELIEKYRIIENEKFLGNEDKVNEELERYESEYADLFLIAYANKLKQDNKKILLITEESFHKDKKLIPKIPIICNGKNEKIFCRKLPYALFDFYKDELRFSLDIVEKN